MLRSHRADTHDRPRLPRRGISLLEVLAVIVIVAMVLALLIPALIAARDSARRSRCALNQQAIGAAWQLYIRDEGAFPSISQGGGAWTYAGVTFSRIDGRPTLDYSRPINRFLSGSWIRDQDGTVFQSPVDRGIKAGGTGEAEVESAYRSFGTSYRANDALFSKGLPLKRAEIAADPSRLVIMGAPFWYEVLHDTGRSASWYGAPDTGIVLFLDNSTRTIRVERGNPRTEAYTFIPGRRAADPNPTQEERTGR